MKKKYYSFKNVKVGDLLIEKTIYNIHPKYNTWLVLEKIKDSEVIKVALLHQKGDFDDRRVWRFGISEFFYNDWIKI